MVNLIKQVKRAKKGVTKEVNRAQKAALKRGIVDRNEDDMGMGGLATKEFQKSVEEQYKMTEKKRKLKRLRKLKRQKANADANKFKQGEEVLSTNVKNPFDTLEVGELVSRMVKPLEIDVRSIGGTLLHDSASGNANNRTNILLKEDEKPTGGIPKKESLNASSTQKFYNECLFCTRVGKFDITGGDAFIVDDILVTGAKKVAKKAKNKLRYMCIIRSTNYTLMTRNRNSGTSRARNAVDDDEDDLEDDELLGDGGVGNDYDTMFNPEDEDHNDQAIAAGGQVNDPIKPKSDVGNPKNKKKDSLYAKKPTTQQELNNEISSFPYIVFLALHADGTCPDFRRIMPLSQLTSIVGPTEADVGVGGKRVNQVVKLAFKTGETVTFDLSVGYYHDPTHDNMGDAPTNTLQNEMHSGVDNTNLKTDTFLWSLLQIHAILCTSVVEQYLATNSSDHANKSVALPFLSTHNIDKAELQYSSTINHFLSGSPILCALLERQRTRQGDPNNAVEILDDIEDELGEKTAEEVDGMAYDMMMGNYSRYALFTTPEEELYAEEILNATPWKDYDNVGSSEGCHDMIDPTYTHESLTVLLQRKMRDLEAEACRRLIAWEDEKDEDNNDTSFTSALSRNDSVDAMSLMKLADTLENLDVELNSMEKWLEERSKAIAPLTKDCHNIEEENRQLKQQQESFQKLGEQLYQILHGLEIPTEYEKILRNPKSVLILDSTTGHVDIFQSEGGVRQIHEAGRALFTALQKANDDKFVFLYAIGKQAQGLLVLAKSFSDSIARIVVQLMEHLASSHISDLEMGKIAKDDSHTTMVKKLRDTQKRFHGSLLLCFKMVEVLYLLHQELLVPMRDAYAALVVEGILSKKRMKRYFSSLPFRQSGRAQPQTMDMKEYHSIAYGDSQNFPSVNAEDVKLALTEILPVIAREAYFVAVIFGPPADKLLDGREKKRNFEATKKAVDRSSTWFRYYMYRVCGITQTISTTGKEKAEKEGFNGNPMLALISSIHLNEAMENYIDKDKKGGVQSLSLAYTRATIFDLRKKVDKEWSSWVEEQIKWIRSHHGVPANGKRAGVFESFSKFPAYLDHVVLCCKRSYKQQKNNGKPAAALPSISKIKFVSYYLQKLAGELFASLHECAERETTDQQYAANVMRMENSYFFIQSIKHRGSDLISLFEKQLSAANTICKKSTDAYLGWMVKREFKALHNLFSNISRIRKDVGDADVPIHVPKATFIKTLAKECNREILKDKIKIIYSRMEKHLSDSSGLLPVTWKALVKVLYEWFGRWEKLSNSCYSYTLEPSAVDVVRIAKAAAGSSAPSTNNANAGVGGSHRENGNVASGASGQPNGARVDNYQNGVMNGGEKPALSKRPSGSIKVDV